MADLDQAVDPVAIRERIEHVLERIERACRRVGRAASDVTLIAVTKSFPVEAIDAARAAGIANFGENRVQELVEKVEHVAPRCRNGDVHWHMIGHLQRNKARDVAGCADYFHALDSRRLARELDRRAAQVGREIPCFVQVNMSGETTKFGIDPSDTFAFLDDVATYEHLRIRGLMTIASFVPDAEQVRPEFRRLRELLESYAGRRNPHVEMNLLSMGMSADFEVAVEEGATHLRIGSALFGERS